MTGGKGAGLEAVVSDKDLSALQQRGLSEIGSALRQADRLPALIDLSQAIRILAGDLLKQGVSARHLR